MKKLKYLFPIFLALMNFQIVTAQTVDEICDKFVAAIGGKEKLMALNSLKMDGTMNTNGIDIGITVTVLNGKGSRTDINVPGMDPSYRIATPTKAWTLLTYAGQTSPQESSESAVRASQNALDLQTAFLNSKEKGYKLELLGKEAVNGAEAFKIKIINKNGAVSTAFIDTKTYYRVKIISTMNTNGKDTEVSSTYGDFRKTAEGYVFPFTQTNSNGEINFSTIEVNKPVDESIFVVK